MNQSKNLKNAFDSSIAYIAGILLDTLKDYTAAGFNLRSNDVQMTRNIIQLYLNSKQK
jgi:hypothetical protein